MPDYIQFIAPGYITHRWESVDPSVVEGLPNILEISRDRLHSLTSHHLVENGQVRLMTPTEAETYDAAILAQQRASELTRLATLDTSLTEITAILLPKLEAQIDAIANLADVKLFLKRLVRGLAKRL